MHNILLCYDAQKWNKVWLQNGWPVHKTWDTHKHYFKDCSTFVMTLTFNSSLNSSNGACKLSSSIPSLAAKDSAVQNMYLTILSLFERVLMISMSVWSWPPFLWWMAMPTNQPSVRKVLNIHKSQGTYMYWTDWTHNHRMYCNSPSALGWWREHIYFPSVKQDLPQH